MEVEIAVLGAGVMGLSTAVNIIESDLPGVQVTVISEQFSPHTTSDGAAGRFGPRLGIPGFNFGVPLHVYRKWCQTSFDHFDKIARSKDGPDAGVTIVSGYALYTRKENIAPFVSQDIVYHQRTLSTKEMEQFPPKYKYGFFITTTMTECRKYLPWLMRRFKHKGGKVMCKKVQSVEELIGQFHLVVNCTGIGSHHLFKDPLLVPMRGQIMRIKAPWIKHFYFTDDKCHVYPCINDVTVGGVKQIGTWNMESRDVDREVFWNNCLELIPSLKEAKYVCDWVGLRPFREPIRIEKDVFISSTGQTIPVVHNYGHGSSGIGLSWGTAVAATDLVKEAIHQMQNPSGAIRTCNCDPTDNCSCGPGFMCGCGTKCKCGASCKCDAKCSCEPGAKCGCGPGAKHSHGPDAKCSCGSGAKCSCGPGAKCGCGPGPKCSCGPDGKCSCGAGAECGFGSGAKCTCGPGAKCGCGAGAKCGCGPGAKCSCGPGGKCSCGAGAECSCGPGAKCTCRPGAKCGCGAGAECSCGPGAKCTCGPGAKCGCGPGAKCSCGPGGKCSCGAGAECGFGSGAKCSCVPAAKCGYEPGAKCICGAGTKCGCVSGAKCGCVSGAKCSCGTNCQCDKDCDCKKYKSKL